MNLPPLARSALLGLFLLQGALFNQGCVLFVAGGMAGATVAYINGQLEAEEQKPIDAVWRATQRAVDRLGFEVIKESRDALTGVMKLKAVPDKNIDIKVESLSERRSKILIRVGVFGDESISKRILRSIERELGE